MAERDQTRSPPLVNRVSDAAKTTARSTLSPLRQRGSGRTGTLVETYSTNLRRTSSLGSTFSDSIDDARNSIKSSTDDLFRPQVKSPDVLTDHEPSHWHSIPLALALLPAIGGLCFEKGSVVVTDVTLLGLAAVFLNWSVRLPWDWYHSAQKINIYDDDDSFDNGYRADAIIEEEEGEGGESESVNGSQQSRPTSPAPRRQNAASRDTRQQQSQASASHELRMHELLALATCFIFPLIGAWLLHYIRAQLSRPSEGLVSNYNLTIFLLASELRPLSHLIKLVQARTLYLQRTVANNPHISNATPAVSPTALKDLTTRLTDLETHIADSATTPTTPKQLQAQFPELTLTIRKQLQPDLDALNRAVRRYEKRATLLSMQTEKRLQDLESRMGDAITLAAAAERASQSQKQRRNSGLLLMMDGLAKMLLFPVQLAWTAISLPAQAMASAVGYVEGIVGRKIRKELRTAGRRVNGGSSNDYNTYNTNNNNNNQNNNIVRAGSGSGSGGADVEGRRVAPISSMKGQRRPSVS